MALVMPDDGAVIVVTRVLTMEPYEATLVEEEEAPGMFTWGWTIKPSLGESATTGTATLTAGAATVSTTAVTATSRVVLTSQADGGTPGFLRVTARTPGVSFAIGSSSALDTSTVAWILIEP